MTIDHIYNEYITSKAHTVAEHTLRSYISAYDKHLLREFGYRDIESVKYIDYQKFANNLLLSGKKPKTVKNILAVMIGIYKFAIKNDWYDGKIYPEIVDLPSLDNKFYVPHNVELQKAYLIAIYNFEELIYRDMFLMLLHGRRLGEVLNLKWEYIDLNESLIYYAPENNKSRKHRTYRLTDFMTDILRQYHARDIDLQNTVFPTGYVFKNPKTGKPFRDLKRPWRRLLDRANLPYTKLHSIRHILGTYLVNTLKVDILSVSYMLGHSDVSVTMKYYTPSPDISRDCTQAVVDSLKQPSQREYDAMRKAIDVAETVDNILFPNNKTTPIRSNGITEGTLFDSATGGRSSERTNPMKNIR